MPFKLAEQTRRGFSAWSGKEGKLRGHRYTTPLGSQSEALRSHFKELLKISPGQTETFGSSLQRNRVKIGCTRVSCLLQKQPLNAIK